jgi:hypothetical protein
LKDLPLNQVESIRDDARLESLIGWQHRNDFVAKKSRRGIQYFLRSRIVVHGLMSRCD